MNGCEHHTLGVIDISTDMRMDPEQDNIIPKIDTGHHDRLRSQIAAGVRYIIALTHEILPHRHVK